MKVISGGQTGVDVLALEVARECGHETGGSVPHDYPRGENVERYGLTRMLPAGGRAAGLVARSKKNVDDAEGTLVFLLSPTPGSSCTANYAGHRIWRMKASPGAAPYKPTLILKDLRDVEAQARRIAAFLTENRVSVLNVAGPRSLLPMQARAVRKILLEALE